MSEVKRYTPTDTSHNYIFSFEMEEDNYGDYVLYSDYQKLQEQLGMAENIIRAYADAVKDQTVNVSIPYDDLDPEDFDIIEEFESGEPYDFGEKAREYFKEKENK